MKHYTTIDANVNSAAYRAEQRPGHATREQRIAHLKRYLERAKPFEYTDTYQKSQMELAQLESEAE